MLIKEPGLPTIKEIIEAKKATEDRIGELLREFKDRYDFGVDNILFERWDGDVFIELELVFPEETFKTVLLKEMVEIESSLELKIEETISNFQDDYLVPVKNIKLKTYPKLSVALELKLPKYISQKKRKNNFFQKFLNAIK